MEKDIKNAVVEDLLICYSKEDELTAWLVINFGNAKQGFGDLKLPQSSNKFYEFVSGILSVVGVSDTKTLISKAVRVYHDTSKIYAIGNFIDDVWLSIDSLELKTISEIKALYENRETIEQDENGSITKHYGMKAEAGAIG